MNVYILIIKGGELDEVVDGAWLNRRGAEDYMSKWGGLRIEEIEVADAPPNHEFKSDAKNKQPDCDYCGVSVYPYCPRCGKKRTA